MAIAFCNYEIETPTNLSTK